VENGNEDENYGIDDWLWNGRGLHWGLSVDIDWLCYIAWHRRKFMIVMTPGSLLYVACFVGLQLTIQVLCVQFPSR
jgi:hypothetical protein